MLVQLQILNLILSSGNFGFVIDNNLNADYFPNLRKEFNFIFNHYQKYGVVPDQATFLNSFPDFEIIQVRESEDYLLNELYRTKKETFLANTFNKIRDLLMAGKTDEAMNLYSS